VATQNELEGIVEENERDFEDRLKDFSQLLKSIESIDEQKRHLWREVYQNAIADRQNAFIMFKRTVTMVSDNSTQMAVHGRTIEKFLEKMSRANDQLIKLAQLVADAQHADDDGEIDPDDMFNRIRT
jgi:hypothetical protein